MWDLPGPGIKPVSPALAGGFSTTVPPGKSLFLLFLMNFYTDLPLSPPKEDQQNSIIYSLNWLKKNKGHKEENILFEILGEGKFCFEY